MTIGQLIDRLKGTTLRPRVRAAVMAVAAWNGAGRPSARVSEVAEVLGVTPRQARTLLSAAVEAGQLGCTGGRAWCEGRYFVRCSEGLQQTA